MGLFSKEECEFCKQKVGILSRKKLRDKKYICKECEKNCSAFIEISKFDSEYAKQHMEYMKKQDLLYKKEFETLSKEEKVSAMYQFEGLVFADSIAMFEIVTPKAKKKNYKELFRYDQIKDYQIYKVANSQEGGKKYSEIGVKIDFYCREGISTLGMSEDEKGASHPYLETIKICYGKNVNDICSLETVINHLDKIFLREPTFKSVGRSIKESFTGTETEKRNIKQGADMLKALGGLAKAKMSGNEDAMESAKANMKDNLAGVVNSASGNRIEYKKIADSVEKRVWGE